MRGRLLNGRKVERQKRWLEHRHNQGGLYAAEKATQIACAWRSCVARHRRAVLMKIKYAPLFLFLHARTRCAVCNTVLC